jgi:hypothetical protein
VTRLTLLVGLALATGACKKQEAPAPAPAPTMPAVEQQRSTDACKAYVDKVCSCADTVPAAVEQCKLAKALPDAMRISFEVGLSPDSKPDVARAALDGVRKTARECIEQTAKLPALGCP